jgi:D-alanyl-lipoteichoic acid acyltransferase DltB (MBOAT superfamily)
MAQSPTKQQRKPWLALSLIINLGLLIGFKYWNFIGYNLNSLFGTHFEFHHLLLPLGLSFYTLQTLSYSFDVYLAKVKPEPHLGYFCLYVSFFPQLVAGPIERSRRLLPQLKSLQIANRYQFRYGVLLIIWGFFLKLVIADNLTAFIDSIYFTKTLSPCWLYWLVGGLVTVKIYCDFMAYSEIARGLALLFGVQLTLNFRRPLLATNLRSFWQRWHISLTRWIGDYIQIPLLQKYSASPTRVFITIFTLCLIGLWHGASWNFIFFGLFHGVMTVIWSPVARLFKQRLVINPLLQQSWGRVSLAFILMFSAPLFYITDMQLLQPVLFALFDFETLLTRPVLIHWNADLQLLIQALLGILILSGYSFMAEYSQIDLIEQLAKSHSSIRWGASMMMLLLIFVIGNVASERFIYFKF